MEGSRLLTLSRNTLVKQSSPSFVLCEFCYSCTLQDWQVLSANLCSQCPMQQGVAQVSKCLEL